MGKLDQKVAVITGSSRGIGKEIALTFAREGAHIVLCARGVEALEEAAQEVKSLGRRALAVRTDVSKREDVENLINTAIDNFKQVDILVNNAALESPGTLLEMTEEMWDAVINVDLKGTFLCTQAAARHMIERRYGKIINISSICGLHVTTIPGNYAAAKAGVNHFTKVCATELGPYGINVNAIAPGIIKTDLLYKERTPAEVDELIADRSKRSVLGRVGNTQDIANLALFLASDESSFITGQVIAADGGRLLC